MSCFEKVQYPYLNFLSLQQINLREVCSFKIKRGQICTIPLCTQPFSDLGLSVQDGHGISQGSLVHQQSQKTGIHFSQLQRRTPSGRIRETSLACVYEINLSKIHSTTNNSSSHTQKLRRKHNMLVGLMQFEC